MEIVSPSLQNFHENYEILHIKALCKNIKHLIKFEEKNSIKILSNAILEL